MLLGLDPDPAELLPAARAAADAATSPAERAAARGARALRRADRRGRRRLRRGEAAAGLLRAARRAGLGVRLREVAGARARRPACWWSPTASAATCRTPRPPTRQALLGATETPWGTGRRPGRRRGHREPAAGPRLARADRRRGARGAAPACSCWCAPRTPARPRSRTTRRAAGRRCASVSPRSCTSSARDGVGRRRALRRRRGRGGDRARAAGGRCASACRTPCSCCPGSARRAAASRTLAPAFAGRPRGGARDRVAVDRRRGARGRATRRPRCPRRSACATRPGRSRG